MEALAGVLVLEFDCGMAGAMAGMFLCDQGAQVVKVEPPQGARERAHPGHRVWNRGKQSLVASPADSAELKECLARADVVIHGAPGESTSVPGLALARLSAGNPGLITCALSGYGALGPLANQAANDALVAANFGLPALQRGWGDGPSYIFHPLASIGAALLAVQGICAALLARAKSGHGQRVETSLHAGLYALTAYSAGEHVRPIRTDGWKAFGPNPLFSIYECADGRWLHLACIHRGFARQALQTLGLEDMLLDPRYNDGFGLPAGEPEETLFRRVVQTMKMRPAAEWTALLEAADVPFAIVQQAEALLSDPQYRLNGIAHVDDPESGPTEQMGVPVRLHDTPGLVRGPAPRLGQHDRLSTVSYPRPEVEPPGAGGAPAADGPLAGMRVLEMANVIAGPMAGRFLADLGAEVIKLESPDGGDISRRNGSPAFLALNAGKQGLAVDLRAPAGRQIGQQLAGRADVLIDNMRPGVAEKLGMGWDTVRSLNPRLIYCHATAFGSRGPYAHKPGLDPLAGSLAGVQLAQGAYCGKPVYLQVAAVDHTTSLLACSGILLALLARTQTGRGQKVETSLLDGAALMMSDAVARSAGQPERQALPCTQYGLHALHRLYQAADGWICITLETDAHWQALCEVIGQRELLGDARFISAATRIENDDVLAAEIAGAFWTESASHWIERLTSSAVPCAPVTNNQPGTFLSDAQAIANGMLAKHQHAALGTVCVPHRWLRFSETPGGCRSSAPLLGQHTREVLASLGYTGPEIERLREEKVVSWDSGA